MALADVPRIGAMTAFGYAPEIVARYPNVVGGVIFASGLANGPTPDVLQAAYLEEQRQTLSRIGGTPLSEIPSLAAWRKVFRGFGVDPTQYRSAAEALLRRLTKSGDIPCINALVDAGNLVSVRHALPVAVFDTRSLSGQLTVRFAAGDELFTPLGEQETEHPEPGEAIFADAAGLVFARRWCWRQSEQSAARAEIGAAIITIEGHHHGARDTVGQALEELHDLLARHSGGSFQVGIVDAENPALQPA
ncbi:MAG: hypothetical protein KGJ86_20465 [Chloroflexota bacterium]|nr:hypothetical protein [Chloroflexota bacterium]